MLYAVEWLTIAVGTVAAIVVLAVGHRNRAHTLRDEAAVVLEAKSACDGATGPRAIVRAWLDGAELPAEPTAPEPVLDDALRARGRELFAANCTPCHGVRGDGKGVIAAQLAIPPADLRTGLFTLRTTEHEALPTDVDLFRTITRGVHGTAMPPWFALPEHDRWALVAYIEGSAKSFSDDTPPAPIDVTQPPVTTPARVEHGRQLFASVGCASCHGAEGRGDGPAAASLTYPSGVPARPRDLGAGRFHRATHVSDTYLTLTAGLDNTPMGSFAKVLSSDDRWDIAMFVTWLAPAMVDRPGGLRCPVTPLSEPNSDELAAARALVRSLPSMR